jgi:hypothetical protein
LGLWFVQIGGQNRHHIHIRNNRCTQMDPAVAEIGVVHFVDFEIGFEGVVVGVLGILEV